jgi:hypothetical protein
MLKNERNYPWYKYKGQDVVLIDASENPKAEQLGVENNGDIYAVLLEVASRNFDLNVENCKTTYILDYMGDSDWDIDNGEEIIVSKMKNPENNEHIIECWGTLDDFNEE